MENGFYGARIELEDQSGGYHGHQTTCGGGLDKSGGDGQDGMGWNGDGMRWVLDVEWNTHTHKFGMREKERKGEKRRT